MKIEISREDYNKIRMALNMLVLTMPSVEKDIKEVDERLHEAFWRSLKGDENVK